MLRIYPAQPFKIIYIKHFSLKMTKVDVYLIYHVKTGV